MLKRVLPVRPLYIDTVSGTRTVFGLKLWASFPAGFGGADVLEMVELKTRMVIGRVRLNLMFVVMVDENDEA